jgi:ATP-binding cassette subfamily B protein
MKIVEQTADADSAPRSSVTIDNLFQRPQQRKDWRRLPRLIRQAFSLVRAAAGRTLLLVIISQLAMGIIAGLQILIAKQALTVILAGKPPTAMLSSLLPLLIVVAVSYSVARYAAAVQSEKTQVLIELVSNYTSAQVLDVAGRVNLAAFDDSSFYDRVQRAVHTGSVSAMGMVRGVVGVGGSAARVSGLLVALAVIKPVLLAPLVVIYIPMWYLIRRNSADSFQFFIGMTPLERRRDYMRMLLTDYASAKEVRAFGLVDFLRGRFNELAAEHVAELARVSRRRLRRQLTVSVEYGFFIAAAVAALVWLYASKNMSLAATTVTAAALLQLSGLLSAMGVSTGGLYEGSLFLEEFNAFMRLGGEHQRAPQACEPVSSFQDLVVERVKFTYPAAAKPCLSEVSLHIKAGEIVALVGENGSGKTTLAKILAGLYQPESGEILLNGMPVDRYDPDAVRSLIAVVFQDFVRYHLTARENIGLGCPERLWDAESIERAALMSGARDVVGRLPQGLETVLGPEFLGGQDLSIGQWQKVALARAFFRDAPFVVLDEPTASLDARAEREIFDSVRRLFKDRAVLLISHRFASVRSADRIYVLRSGEIVEEGDHDALMTENGLYAELYNMQAAAYQD